MKKILKASLFVTTIIGSVFLTNQVFADQVVQGTSANVEVNGTLGADNTKPDAPIPEGDSNWINVTVPTSTIFYNTPQNTNIKSPNYSIINHSGRPVEVSTSGLVGEKTNVEPNDFNLILNVQGTTSNAPVAASTQLIKDGKIQTPLNVKLITLANKDGKITKDGIANIGDNSTIFTYSGSSSVNTMTSLKYNLGLTFKAVDF